MKRITALFLIVFLFAGALFGCAPPLEPESGRLKIVATNFPAFDFAREVAGELADVSMLVGTGADSHGFEPSAAQLVEIKRCDLFVYIGGESESWVMGVLDSAGGEMAAVALGRDIERLPLYGAESAEAGLDEHIWTSLKNARMMVDALVLALGEIDAPNKETYAENAENYKQQLELLDSRYSAAAESAKRRDIVFSGRFAFLYLFKDYSLEPVASVYSCGAAADPSAADVARVVDYIEQTDVAVFFKLTDEKNDIAELVATETGAEFFALNAAHSAGESERYLEIMEDNLTLLERALGQ